MSHGFSILMYHELSSPGRPLCFPDRGYAKYAVDSTLFALHVQRLRAEGLSGSSIGHVLATQPLKSRVVAISFDDGCATDLTEAAPVLMKAGFGATSFVTVGFLGQRGFMDASMVRELSNAGFEIGSHAVTHRFLPDLGDQELVAEVTESRDTLEQIIGRPVTHFSCPGGRYDRRVVTAVREAGYVSMATSRIGVCSVGGDPFNLPRIAVTSGASPDYAANVSHGRGLLKYQMRAAALDAAKSLLGNRLYVAVRAAALGDRSR